MVGKSSAALASGHREGSGWASGKNKFTALGKRWQAPFAGTALRVLRTKGACHLFPGISISAARLGTSTDWERVSFSSQTDPKHDQERETGGGLPGHDLVPPTVDPYSRRPPDSVQPDARATGWCANKDTRRTNLEHVRRDLTAGRAEQYFPPRPRSSRKRFVQHQ